MCIAPCIVLYWPQTLDLAPSRLVGTIPPSFSALTALTRLAVPAMLEGPLPPQLAASLTRMTVADLRQRALNASHPGLCGACPDTFATWTASPRTFSADCTPGRDAAFPAAPSCPSTSNLILRALRPVWDSGFSPRAACDLSSWAYGADPCAGWAKVNCSGGFSLDLSGCVAHNVSASELGWVPHLEPELARLEGQVAAPVRLAFRGAALQGTVPAEWSSMASLREVDFSHLRPAESPVDMAGGIPGAWTVALQPLSPAAYTTLQTLDVSSNIVTGALPADWQQWSSLVSLGVSGTAVSGALPAAWSRLNRLTRLALGSPGLQGPLPAEWRGGPLAGLSDLTIEGTGLDDTIDWSVFGVQLQHLHLRSNPLLKGPVAGAGSLTNLVSLDLSNNDLSGSLPPLTFSSSRNLTSLRLDGNRICGSAQPVLNPSNGAVATVSSDLPRACPGDVAGALLLIKPLWDAASVGQGSCDLSSWAAGSTPALRAAPNGAE
ncbi:hypothetical protein GPECTOR_46g223 [Gonium pectorale]|uniref:Leucine-rich repeat-containing N-terminal plant-type domain-containing protein n=1 Tax=Gonium pectorale TaxID=33097 RepID=A0A150G8J3_GONPE|nr:hypothetical protein GPECTOR_46g223 [Gonium pectorale]|eukprot:KXZ46154.1 hypothetical protein GPECTOR_46g223 [Gonium pectorale]